ncbi:MAG: hypothetical protein JO022_20220, partial [Acidobacteriaceae bacterium]|nr:hypothetical protein [Acidobacteriaceae bacterium]
KPVWTQRFQGGLAAMAESVARATFDKTRVGKFHDHAAQQRTSANALAYQRYLEADFRGAVRADPKYAAAWARLGEWKKALALSPDLPDAHAAHARALWTPAEHFAIQDATEEYRRAIAADPQMADARCELSWILLHQASFQQAAAEAEAATNFDPTDPDYRFHLALVRLYSGQYQEAVELFKQVPRERHPLMWYSHAAWAHLELHQTTRAAYYLEEYDRRYGIDTDGLMSSVYAMLQARFNNQRQATAAIAAALEDPGDHGYFHHTAYFVAKAYASLHQPEDSAFWLKQAKSNGFPAPPAIK